MNVTANTRGITRKRIGSMAMVVKASISSLIFIVPISAAKADAERLASTIAVNKGPSSRIIERAIRSATKITFTLTTPSHLRQLLRLLPASPSPLLPDLKLTVGTAPLSSSERQLIDERLTPRFIELYGTNEAGLITLATAKDRSEHGDTVGHPAKGIEVQIVDEHDKLLDAGKIGHLRCRGPDFPTAYLNNPEATQRHFRSGWFYPGDLASVNEAGYVFLKGRSDDQINTQGVKFYPIETESVLLTHPSVREAAVIGYPDAVHGEVGAGFIVGESEASLADIKAHCQALLPPHKCPVLLMRLQQLPRNRMGKVLKRELRKILDNAIASQTHKGQVE